MAIAAADAQGHVDQLVALTERLTDMLSTETRAFEARRPQDAAPGSAETVRLANIYRHESARIRSDPSLIADAPKARRERLVTATQAFEQALARHGRSVRAAKTVTEGVVQAIAREVASQRSGLSAYGPRAETPIGDSSAITLNRRA